MKSLLELKNVEKYYGSKNAVTKALDKISFQVRQGEFISIMGSSGSGKTTLLNCISTIDQISAGHILLNDQDISEIKAKNIARFRRENLGFIFQDFNLLDTLTIEENIALPLTVNQVSPLLIPSLVKEIAIKLNIADILNKFPYQTSGGQKQRCACARAMVHGQKLLLADEPTGALDSEATSLLLEVFQQMNQQMAATILMVTHDPLSASYSQRVLFLKDGKIYNELLCGNTNRQLFYHQILDVLAALGGDTIHVR